MNKQQLANKIWESANKMRSKIEANEYKDYILGFIFYKFLSDKEVDFLKKDGYEETDLQEHVHENNEERIPGAVKIGNRWAIPDDEPKPADARIKSGKYVKNPTKN